MSALTRLRRFWLDVHLWIGVALLIPFVILGITGSVLTFHDELERALEPHRYELSQGAPLPLATQIENARAALDQRFVITAVRPPESADAPLIVQARAKGRPTPGQRPEQRSVYLDPASGRVLDIANPRGGVFGIMHQLHGSLMIPEFGRKVVGWLGWAMLISSLTGIWLWWPRNGALLRGLKWQRTPKITSNLHYLVGFWIAIPLAILAFTGVYISFPQMSRGALAAVTGVPSEAQRGPGGPPGGGPLPIETPNLSADAVLVAVQEATPGARILAINLPTPGRDGEASSWRVQVKAPDIEANVNVTVDDATGEADTRGLNAQQDQNVARFMRRLHDGTDYSLFWRAVIAIAGFAPALFGVTGIIMWLRRRAARRAIQRGAKASHV